MVRCIKVRWCCLYYFDTLWQQTLSSHRSMTHTAKCHVTHVLTSHYVSLMSYFDALYNLRSHNYRMRISVTESVTETGGVCLNCVFSNHRLACLWCSLSSEEMSSVWQQEPSGYSPCLEIDSSSLRCKDRLIAPAWLKQEQDDLRIIKWENFQTGASADAVQDNTPSSAMSGESTLTQRWWRRASWRLLTKTSHWSGWNKLSTSSSTFSRLTCGRPASEGAAHHHQAPVHAGEQTGAHRRTGETGGGPDAGSQVPQDPDWEPHQQPLHAVVCVTQSAGRRFVPEVKLHHQPAALRSDDELPVFVHALCVVLVQLCGPAKCSTLKTNLGRGKEFPAAPLTAAKAARRHQSRLGFQQLPVNSGGRNTTGTRKDRRKGGTTAEREVMIEPCC